MPLLVTVRVMAILLASFEVFIGVGHLSGGDHRLGAAFAIATLTALVAIAPWD